MNIIYAQSKLNINTNGSIFLAGPSPRDKDTPSWRPFAIDYLHKFGYDGNVYIPEMLNGWEESYVYTDQIEWEEKALNKSDVIVFWIPRDLKTMPAFTTNIEWGYWTSKNPKKIILGYPKDTEKMNYLKYYADKLNIPVTHTLKETMVVAMNKIQETL